MWQVAFTFTCKACHHVEEVDPEALTTEVLLGYREKRQQRGLRGLKLPDEDEPP